MSTTGQAKDLAGGAGQTVPLKPKENFEGRPHLPTRRNLAALIVRMPYGELRDVAAEFASMKDAEVRPKTETAEEYANLLWDWAESVGHE